MTTASPLLSYRGRQALPSRVLVVERADDRMTVTWPVPPPWFPWAMAGWNFAVAAAKAVTLGWLVVLLWRVRRMFAGPGVPWQQVVWSTSVVFGVLLVGVLFWATHGVLIVRRHRRWGQVPRVLTVTPTGLTLDWLDGRRMRRREWPADRVTAVDWRPVAHVFRPRVRVVRVVVRFAAGRPWRFTLGSRDPTCVERGRRGLQELLGRPVGVPD